MKESSVKWYWKVTKRDDFGQPLRRVKVYRRPTLDEMLNELGEALL